MSVACAAPDDESSSAGVTGSGGSTATATNGAAASSVADVGVGVGTSGSGGSGDCGPGKGDIFVLSKEYDLHRFEPKALTFSKVGPLSCPQGGGSATPFSMAVDRAGTAWVLYNDGKLYKVSTADASCDATTFVPNQLGFKKFGMGFATDAPGSDAETLFVASETGLGSIDLGTLAVKKRGSFGFSAAVELTGNANAELFGLFFGFPTLHRQARQGHLGARPRARPGRCRDRQRFRLRVLGRRLLGVHGTRRVKLARGPLRPRNEAGRGQARERQLQDRRSGRLHLRAGRESKVIAGCAASPTWSVLGRSLVTQKYLID
ncbi:MAG: hypothetical protein FJ095_01865 [Deltaproteobacteria bacterium]|nr:hypothetical protein [Deltaproteobacteria bacterium]